MSSDYISRLRAELLRAGAARQAPRRRASAARRLCPVVAAVAVALLVGALMLTVPDERGDDRATAVTVSLSFRAPSGAVVGGILRERLGAAGITAEISGGNGTLTITAPRAARADVIALTAPGRFAIYDWERSVLGPGGRAAPSDPAVTGGAGAGQQAALTEAEARSRADKRPGARVLRGDSGWYALEDAPGLTNADVAGARAGKDPVNGDPVVAIDLTRPGQEAFRTLTRELAQRGADHALGGDPLETSQHLALVLDDRILATPYVNWREAPDGIDGAAGTHLSGLRTPEQARLTAALLSSGPLPERLERISG